MTLVQDMRTQRWPVLTDLLTCVPGVSVHVEAEVKAESAAGGSWGLGVCAARPLSTQTQICLQPPPPWPPGSALAPRWLRAGEARLWRCLDLGLSFRRKILTACIWVRYVSAC